MGLSHEILHGERSARVRSVCCRPADHGESRTEYVGGFQLVFPTAGSFRVHTGRTESVFLDATQVLCLPPDRPHRYSHPESCGDVCLSIELDREVLDGCLDALDPKSADRDAAFPVHRAVLSPGALRRRALLEHRLRAGVADALEVEETLLQLMADWLAARGAMSGSRHERASTLRDHRERIEAIQRLLGSDPGHAFTLDELSRRVFLSPCHLTTVFRRLTGLPIHRYLLRLRLAASLDQVLGTDREMTEVACDLGFTTPSHFAARFRRAFGSSPSILRKNVTAPKLPGT
jgi:AraC-like DNA-binding protein